MTRHKTPEEEARARLHAQILGAVGAAGVAPGMGRHPGHWQLHHIALPGGGPGDFTPYQAPEYIEEELSPFGELLEHLAEILGPDHAQAIALRGLEAGQ
jgi:hypothetical protein